jgi:hypothetical protein
VHLYPNPTAPLVPLYPKSAAKSHLHEPEEAAGGDGHHVGVEARAEHGLVALLEVHHERLAALERHGQVGGADVADEERRVVVERRAGEREEVACVGTNTGCTNVCK